MIFTLQYQNPTGGQQHTTVPNTAVGFQKEVVLSSELSLT